MKKVKNNIIKTFVLVFVAVLFSQFMAHSGLSVAADMLNSSFMASKFGELEFDNNLSAYKIETANHLISFSKSVNQGVTTKNKTFIVTANIDLDGKNFSTIASAEANKFKGTFKALSNSVTINNLNVPLFGYISEAKITGIEVIGKKIEKAQKYLGGIVCYAESSSKITQCSNSIEIKNTHESSKDTIYTGGVVGYASYTTISECSNFKSVSNTSDLVKASYVGGIVGKNDYGTVKNCYSLGVSSAINISANSKVEISKPTVVLKKGTSKHYSRLESINQKAQDELNNLRKQLNNAQNDLKKAIQESKTINNTINGVRNQINKLTRDANNSFLGLLWAVNGPLIVTLELSLVPLYATIGLVYLAIEAAELLILTLQAAIDAATKYASILLVDSQWVEADKDATKIVETKNAYAYGIGASTYNVTNCYTANINLTGGYENVYYEYGLRFYANIGTSGYYGWSDVVTKKVTYKNSDKYGRISNMASTNCIYKESKGSYTREISFDSVSNWYEAQQSSKTFKVNVGLNLKDEQLIFEKISKSSNVIKISVANGRGKGKLEISRCDFNSSLQTYLGTACSNSKDTLNTHVGNAKSLDDDYWAVDPLIEGGYPHLKYKYWQDIA